MIIPTTKKITSKKHSNMMLGSHYELKIFKNINWDDGLSYKPIHNEGIDLKGGYYTINIAYFMILFSIYCGLLISY